MRQSIATINSPEFVNLKPMDINPLMSECEIKVLYLGENRNHSYISKEVANDMAKTLRGAPIVGYYKDDKQDFGDHGEQVIFDDEGVHFNCLTKPYGFVAPDAKVWFQKFEETDDFGNTVTREYMMTTGFLWTGQYEECKAVVEEGKGQSMELDEESLDGHWSTNSNTGMDFFIINDAVFSKLCILGDDVEPCFEGANITEPQVSTSFSLDDNFKKTLYTMMQELSTALEGRQQMNTNNEEVVEEVIETTETNVEEENTEAVDTVEVEETTTQEDVSAEEENFVEDDNKNEQTNSEENQNNIEEDENVASIEENTDINSEYELLKQENEELKIQYSKLKEEHEKLIAFKKEVENEKKDELINNFYMLSDEDKKDVIENKENYSLEEIESKLSVICVRKKVNFNVEEEKKEETNTSVMTYSLNNDEESAVPAWISALRKTKNNKQD